jgi:basic membrane protein A
MKDVKNGTFTSGFQSLGLAEEGVGWALDKFNRPLVTSDMENKIEQARQDIISGKIVVKGYKAN